MKSSCTRSACLLSLALGLSVFAATQAFAQQAQPEANKNLIEQLLQRLNKVESELAQLKSEKHVVPADPKDQKVVALLETPYFGQFNYGGDGESRYFAARVIYINLTPNPVTIQREDISLVVDHDKSFPIKPASGNMEYQSFQVGNQSYQLRSLKPAAQVKLAAGQSGATWVTFFDLPSGSQVPALELKTKIGESEQTLDINELALGMLGLEVERIGPRNSLALLTIGGSFNTVNAGGFVDLLEKLATEKVGRVVVRWTDSAPTLDHPLFFWLQQAAFQAGRGENNNNGNNEYPAIPANIRELHFAKIPSPEGAGSRGPSSDGTSRLHQSDLDAVSAALQSAYEVLPRDELLTEIEKGHALTRAAALADGGGRLSDDDIPLILKYADDNDTTMQRAALTALRHFGDRRAIDKLLVYVHKNAEPMASAAIESLAASRYADAQKALLDVLKQETPEAKKAIVKVLARFPRPMWQESIYEFANNPQSEVAAEALTALTRIGHPKLLDVFRQDLQQGDLALKETAFTLLSQRTDPQSEELAMGYVLEHLKQSPPTGPMYALLNRTKDPRTVPLLLEHLKKGSDDRSSLLNTLSVIGDQSVVAEFVKLYGALQEHEKSTVLNALAQLKVPEFRKLAKEAMNSSDGSLINTACQGLQNDGSAEAIAILIEAFETTSNQATLSYVTNALGTLGTPEARHALMEARNSTNVNKRQNAINALRSIRYRSPGMNLVQRAQFHVREKKWDEAIQQYTLAIKLDSELAEAYSGRANIYLKMDKHADAKKDYSKALDLDPYSSEAVTGTALCQVMSGEFEEGIKTVESSRKNFDNDQLFSYNAACVYGRAVEYVKKNEKVEDREAKLEKYRKQAFNDLQQSVQLGFNDFKWMEEDPDLKELRESPEFKKIYNPTPGALEEKLKSNPPPKRSARSAKKVTVPR